MVSRTVRAVVGIAGVAGVLAACGGLASAQSTVRASVDSNGAEANALSYGVSLSGDGRFVAFGSGASNLVPNDSNSTLDIFVHDARTGATERVSVGSGGTEADDYSQFPVISLDGRFVAFMSYADNLVAGDTNFTSDVFVYDRQTGTTQRVSVDTSGAQANNVSGNSQGGPSLSADGRFVAFISTSNNLVAGDANGWYDAFVHDRATGTTTCVSVDANGVPGSVGAQPEQTALSADGRFAVFSSLASNLVGNDTNSSQDVFVRDLQSGTTERIDVDSSGAETVGQPSGAGAISADGRFVLFYSRASNLVAGDTNNTTDVFVHDRQTGGTKRVSVDSAGAQQDKGSSDTGYPVALSADGRFTAFESFATNLVAGDTNACDDIFVHGAPLTLEATPDVVSAGSSLAFTAWTGQASGPTLLAVVGLNGAPLFVTVVFGAFDAQGRWLVGATVPSGLAGNVIEFEEIGFTPSGKVGASNVASVTFQ